MSNNNTPQESKSTDNFAGSNGGYDGLSQDELMILRDFGGKSPRLAESLRLFYSPNGGNPSQGESPPEKPRFTIRSAADALKPQPPIDWIVEGVMSAGSLSVVFGDFGSKKTYIMLSMGVSVALNKPWIGKPTKQTKVLIVDEENGERRLSRRLGACIRGEWGGETTPVDFVSLAQFNLRDAADAVLLQSLIEETGAGLVVIDALVDIMPGGDENATKDVAPVLGRLKKICEETGAAIVVIHHTNKMGGYRGSTAIGGAVDLMLSIESKPDSPNIDFQSIKTRDTESMRFAAVAHFEGDDTPGGEQFWLTESTPAEKLPVTGKGEKYVLLYLFQNGDSPKNEIENNADRCSAGTARNAIYSLAEGGYITRKDTGGVGRTSEAVYGLTEAGDNLASRITK